MSRKLTEDELIRGFDEALANGNIFMNYQPQYNHSTRKMIGAEALMRWNDPDCGYQSPADFIPVLEQNGLIHRADLHAFEVICKFLRFCIDNNINPVPVSFNISRHDIFEHDYVSEIEKIREKYQVPVKFLRAEITESSTVGGIELVISVLNKLHECGYLVEMDDFGAGYSSLNVLKDLDVDVIKLDMRFLSGDLAGRGGTILSSIVRMSKWLNTPTIAEGVETLEKADYMMSIGCNYMQGYLYSRPVRDSEFVELLKNSQIEAILPSMNLIETMDAKKFWSPDSLETLIFSNYVGAAAIFNYNVITRDVEILRVNEKYARELHLDGDEDEILRSNPWNNHGAESRKIYEETMKRAIASGETETCENWRVINSKLCGENKVCIRSSIRVIGKNFNDYVFYALIQNITAEKVNYSALFDSERRFRFASEQANVYAWEYNIATKQMRPCFRCMRDLGLPALVENYPEAAIEMGIFPEECADDYRAFMKKIDSGVEHLEAIFPLTVGRIPFHIRYTNEFDENGKPVKAYASATLVVDGEKK